MRGATKTFSLISIGFSISIHAPRAGCDVQLSAKNASGRVFQSTHPVRGATSNDGLDAGRAKHFNPRTPCGVRRAPWRWPASSLAFQSTHPVRGATLQTNSAVRYVLISIHAPRAGCDNTSGPASAPSTNFNPRTPCGVRRWLCRVALGRLRFQSTHPVRGATTITGSTGRPLVFQSTHPVRGATSNAQVDTGLTIDFNPRTPCGVRLPPLYGSAALPHFNPRTPCGVRHVAAAWARGRPTYFNPRTPCGVRPAAPPGRRADTDFNPRTPCGVRHIISIS